MRSRPESLAGGPSDEAPAALPSGGPGDAQAPEGDPPVRVPLAIEDWLTVLIFGVLVFITFANVLVRYFSNQSFAWTEEISVFLMVILTMVAGSAAVARNRHIRIEAFADGGGAGRRRALAKFSALMVALLFMLLAGLSVRLVIDDVRYEETSPGIGVPQWWYSVWLPVLCALTTARALQLFARLRRASAEQGARP